MADDPIIHQLNSRIRDICEERRLLRVKIKHLQEEEEDLTRMLNQRERALKEVDD